MKHYKIIDNDQLGTLKSTHTTPLSKANIKRALKQLHTQMKSSLSTSRYAHLPSSGEPTLEQLLKAYNLEMVEI